MDYFQLVFKTAEQKDILIAYLSAFPFDSFEEKDNALNAYMPHSEWNESIGKEVTDLASTFNVEVEKNEIKAQNWNAVWESNFEPILIDDFCVLRTDFHPEFPNVKHQILIRPKMAFGTGHHATTYMMMEAMRDINFTKKAVLDYGCGTGVLAILAAKLGANPLESVDIEEAAFRNSEEHYHINNTPDIKLFLGTLAEIKSENFDVILANINRNVILSSLDSLFHKLNNEGILLVSGILEVDAALVINAAQKSGFNHQFTKQREDWLCMSFLK